MSAVRSPSSDSATSTEPSVEELLEQASNGRVTVKRVLEFIRGERTSEEMKGSDWLNAINHVRRDLDETLVLYDEGECAATAICRADYGAIDRVDYRLQSGRHRRYVPFELAKDDLHKTGWEVLKHSEAERRFNEFVTDTRGDH